MSWRVSLGVAILAAASIAAVVVSVVSTSGMGGAEHVKTAVRWPSRCTRVAVHSPSRAAVMRRWSAYTVQTADIVCENVGPYVDFARFRDTQARDAALAAAQPSQRLCLTDTTVVVDHLSAVDSTVFPDMCRNLGGTVNGDAG
jgi:hypothetical protein